MPQNGGQATDEELEAAFGVPSNVATDEELAAAFGGEEVKKKAKSEVVSQPVIEPVNKFAKDYVPTQDVSVSEVQSSSETEPFEQSKNPNNQFLQGLPTEQQIATGVPKNEQSAREYEVSQRNLVGAQKGLDYSIKRDKEASQSVYQDVQKSEKWTQGAAEKLGHAQFIADQNIEKLKESVKPELDYVAENLKDFTRIAETDTVADELKINDYAVKRAKELGLPEDGYFKDFLYNSAKAQVAHKIIEPKVLKERDKLLKEQGLDVKKLMPEKFDKGEEIQAQAVGQINSVIGEVEKLAKADIDSVASQVNTQVNQLNQAYEQQSATVQDQQQSEQLYSEYKANFDKLQKDFLDAQNQINGKYNARIRRQADEIEKVANQKWEEEADKFGDKYNANVDKLKKATEQAYKNVSKSEQAVKNVRDMFTPPVMNFGRTTLSSLGRSVGNYSQTFGYDYGKVLGDYLENSYQPGTTELSSWKDLLDANMLSKSAGQLTGAMLPSMTATVATTMATGGLNAPVAVQMIAGAGAAWLAESADMAGNMYRETFKETGDANKALKKSKQMWDAQMASSYLYTLEGLPFVGKSLSLSKNVAKRMIGGAAGEFITETGQEYFQNEAEDAIKTKDDWTKAFDSMTLKELGHTALQVAPVALLGAQGQIRGEKTEQETINDEAKSFVLKTKFNEIAPDQRGQFLSEMVRKKGDTFTAAYINQLYSNGKIDKETASDLVKDFGIAKEVQLKAKEYGMNEADQKVFTAFKYKLGAAQKQAEQEIDPILKKVAEDRVKELEEQTVNFASGKQADYVILTYPNNEQYILSVSQAENAINNPKLQSAVKDGGMKIEGVGKGVETVNKLSEVFKAEKKAKVDAEKAGLVAETGAFIEDRIATQNANYAQKAKQDAEANIETAPPLQSEPTVVIEANKDVAEIERQRKISLDTIEASKDLLQNPQKEIDKINAKYDAEIAALKPTQDVAGVPDEAIKADTRETKPAPAIQEPITNKKKVGEHFTALTEGLSKDELNTILWDWNEAELNEDGDGIKNTTAFKRNDVGKKTNTFKEKKTDFINWLNSEAPFDEAVYGKDIRNDKEYVDRINKARQVAKLTNEETKTPTQDTPTKSDKQQPSKGQAKGSVPTTQEPVRVEDTKDFSEGRKFALDYVLNDLVDVKPLRPKMTAEESAKMKARKKVVVDGKEVKSIRKAAKDVSQRVDWKMKNEERHRAIRDIKKGKYNTVSAKMLLDRIEQFHDNGYFDFIAGTGGMTVQAGEIPIADIKAHLAEVKALKEEVYADYTAEEQAYFAEQDALINEMIEAIEEGEINEQNIDEQLKQKQDENERAEKETTEDGAGQDVGEPQQEAAPEKVLTEKEKALNKLAESRAALRKKLGAGSGLQLQALPEFIEVVKDAIAAGYYTAKQFVKDFKEDYPNHTEQEIEDAFNEVNKAEDLEKGKEEGEKKDGGEKEKSESREKRKLAQQVLNSKDISQKFKEAITEDAIYYDRFPNNLSLQDANAFLETYGEEEARKAVLDLSNGMRFAPRMILGQVLIKKMNAKGYDAEAVDFSEKFFELSTELGQGIQALSLFQFLTPEGQVKAAQKVVKKMRDKQIKGSYKQIKKLKAAVDKANKEAAEEVVKKVAKKIKKVSEIPDINSPKYGEKNKIVTKDEYNKLLKELRGSMFSNVDPRIVKIAAFHIEAGSREFAQFAETMVKTLGKKVKPYLKDLYKQAQDLFEDKEGFTTDEDILKAENESKGQEIKEKISKALKSGNKKSIEEAIAEISQNGELWGKYKDMAVKRLQQMSMSEIQGDIKQKAVLDEFTQGLIKNIKEQAEKKDEGKSVEKKPAIQIIADAYKNFEKYQEVWEQTKKDFAEKNKDNPEKLAELDAYFGDITLKPFSENLVKQSIKEGLKDLDIKIGEIIKAHYTVYEDYKRSLVNKLIDDAGLSPQEANELAKEIEKEFDKLALEKRKQYLDKALNQKQRSKPNVKQLYEKLLEISNVGVLSDNQFNELYAQKMGYATLTPEQANKIKELAEKVQNAPDGHLKFRAIEDLLKYHANLKGVNYWEIPLAWWYASVLSGHQTQQRNIIANVANTVMLYANAAMQSRSPLFLAKAAVLGMKKGWLEAQDVLQTGYSPIRGKIEVPPVLERIKFEGWKYPANAAKYVRRAMVAADVLFFEAQKEMRAYQLALVQARKEAKLDPTLNERNRTLQILNASNGAFDVAIEQAQLEMETKLQEIENSTLSAKEKAKEKKAAEHAMQRRAYDILNELRPTSIKDESATFASKGTYNYTPQGLLGAMAKSLNSFSDKAWFVRLVVPFVNIISNVANDALNYTPYGFARYATLKKVGENEYEGGSLSGKLSSKEFNENITEQERADMLYKAAMGVAFTAAFLMLSAADDDEEPVIEVTANGTGDWRKNLELRETGWQPYSVRFKKPSGGYTDWVSYQYSPLILALGWVGNIRDFEKYREVKIDDSFISKYGAATSYTMRSIFDMSFLNSADKMLSGIFDIRNENKAEDAYQALQKSAKAFVVPNAYTQSAKMMQDYFDMGQKETRGTWLGYTLRDIPVARGMYKDQINVLGEPVQPDSDVLFSGSEASKELQLLVDKNVFISQPNPLKDTYLDEKDGWKEKEFQTSPEKFYQYAKERGAIIKDFVSANYDYLRTLPKKDVKRIMAHVQQEATNYAKINTQGYDIKPDFNEYMEKQKGNIEEVVIELTPYEEWLKAQNTSAKKSILKSKLEEGSIDEDGIVQLIENGVITKDIYTQIAE